LVKIVAASVASIVRNTALVRGAQFTCVHIGGERSECMYEDKHAEHGAHEPTQLTHIHTGTCTSHRCSVET
jgi:hypothetical protein